MQSNKVAIVGCGTIGAGWAAYFLSRGLIVACSDPAAGAEARLRDAIDHNFALLALDDAKMEDCRERLSFSMNLEPALDGCSWVQENAPEDLTLKSNVIRAIEHALPPEITIASSTSGILPSALQSAMAYPERLIAGHPFIPVSLIGLVEVAGGSRTSAATIENAMKFYASVGKVPIRLHREMVGHIANRLQAALMREAFYLLEQGVASAADIDLAVTEGPGQRWAATGPFVSQHLAGGPGGAEAAFKNLGGALRAMWSDLGNPRFDGDLQAKVLDGINDILQDTSPMVLEERRARVLQVLAQMKAV